MPALDWQGVLTGQPLQWILSGFLTTLWVTLAGAILASLLALLFLLLRLSGGRFGNGVVSCWVSLFRNTPLLVQLLFWYFAAWNGLPLAFRDLVNADHSWSILPGALTVTLALAWFTAATVMHSILAGLSALPGGQYEAALTQGFSTQQTLWRVLLPQVIRNILPSLVGIFISLLKDTSLAFIVNVPELTTVAGQVNNRVQIYPAAIFIFTGVVYYLLCCSLEQLAKRWRINRPAL